MRYQPVTSVTEADLSRVLGREFPGESGVKAAAVLATYGGESWHREPTRVKLAVLKLAHRDLQELERFTAAAKTDYRDVLMWAEYPAYARESLNASEQAREAAVERYWAEYRELFEAR